MNVFYSRAKELQDELVQYRRYLHQNPEVGCNLPNTVKFVKEKLVEMGYEPKDCGECGIVAVAGGKKPGKTFMLRGDMDALPVVEDTSYSFAATNGCSHACGHDIHTASMLGAAKILKEMEDEIDGKVVFMFQPGEEVFKGALSMLNDGLLETYKPDVALGKYADFIVLDGNPLEDLEDLRKVRKVFVGGKQVVAQ